MIRSCQLQIYSGHVQPSLWEISIIQRLPKYVICYSWPDYKWESFLSSHVVFPITLISYLPPIIILDLQCYYCNAEGSVEMMRFYFCGKDSKPFCRDIMWYCEVHAKMITADDTNVKIQVLL